MFAGPPSISGHDPLLRAIAAYGLSGRLSEMPATSLDDPDFQHLHTAVRREQLTGLFWSAILDGAFPVTPAQERAAEDWHLRVLSANLILEGLLVDTVAALTDAGIPVRALKGPAMAHLDYADPAHRSFVDIDLLVPGPLFTAAVECLETRGHRRRYPEPRPGFDGVFGKGVCLVSERSLEIDLHRSFAKGPYGLRLAVDRLWNESDLFVLGGVPIPALSTEGRLLHAAYHATLGDIRPRLTPMRDIAQILLLRDVDWRHVLELAAASGGEAVLARAIRMSWRELWLADLLRASAWAETYQEEDQDTRFLAAYGPDSTYAIQQFAALRAIRGLSQKARFLRALTMPERSYLDGRHSSRLARLQRGAADVRRWQVGNR